MTLIKVSEMKKIFENWSNGTLYNRLDSLGIKGNKSYSIFNETTGTLKYNQQAFELMKEQYLKEFDVNKEIFEKKIQSVLSSGDVSRDTRNMNSKKNDNTDNLDRTDSQNRQSNINTDYLRKFYILKEDHEEIIDSLKSQIETLQKQLEKETLHNEKLIDTLRLREEKDVVIEQQNLVKLQTEVKTIGTSEDNKKQKAHWWQWKQKGV